MTTVLWELHENGYIETVSVNKFCILKFSIKYHKNWCSDHKHGWWTNGSLWYSRSNIPTILVITIWPSLWLEKRLNPAYNIQSLERTGSVRIWAALWWNYDGSVVALRGGNKSQDYTAILADQKQSIQQKLTVCNGVPVFYARNAPIRIPKFVPDWFKMQWT